MLQYCYLDSSCNSTYRLRYWNKEITDAETKIAERCNSTYRLRYWNCLSPLVSDWLVYLLQQHLPLAVLKRVRSGFGSPENRLQQHLPLAVLKLNSSLCYITYCKTVATVLTACGMRRGVRESREQSDDEVRTSLVPDYKEGKTKRMEWKYLLFTVLKRFQSILNEDFSYVATALTACGIETLPLLYDVHKPLIRCNSTYRLRYWN